MRMASSHGPHFIHTAARCRERRAVDCEVCRSVGGEVRGRAASLLIPPRPPLPPGLGSLKAGMEPLSSLSGRRLLGWFLEGTASGVLLVFALAAVVVAMGGGAGRRGFGAAGLGGGDGWEGPGSVSELGAAAATAGAGRAAAATGVRNSVVVKPASLAVGDDRAVGAFEDVADPDAADSAAAVAAGAADGRVGQVGEAPLNPLTWSLRRYFDMDEAEAKGGGGKGGEGEGGGGGHAPIVAADANSTSFSSAAGAAKEAALGLFAPAMEDNSDKPALFNVLGRSACSDATTLTRDTFAPLVWTPSPLHAHVPSPQPPPPRSTPDATVAGDGGGDAIGSGGGAPASDAAVGDVFANASSTSLRLLVAGLGTTGTTQLFCSLCRAGVRAQHWRSTCNVPKGPGLRDANRAVNAVVDLYEEALDCVRSRRGCASAAWLRRLSAAVKDVVASPLETLSDTPFQGLLDAVRRAAAAARDVPVLLTLRDSDAWASKRRGHLEEELVCHPRLWSRVPSPFSYHECAARTADLSDALVTMPELTRSHADDVRVALGEIAHAPDGGGDAGGEGARGGTQGVRDGQAVGGGGGGGGAGGGEAGGGGAGVALPSMHLLLRGLFRMHNDFVMRAVPRAELIPACWWDFPEDAPLIEALGKSDGGRFLREVLGVEPGGVHRGYTMGKQSEEEVEREGSKPPREVVPGEWQAWCDWAENTHV